MGCDSVVLEDFFHSFSVYRCKVLNLKSKYSYVNCQKTLCYACGHFSFRFLFLFPLRAPLQLHQVSAGQIEPPAPTCSRLLSQCVTGISFPPQQWILAYFTVTGRGTTSTIMLVIRRTISGSTLGKLCCPVCLSRA